MSKMRERDSAKTLLRKGDRVKIRSGKDKGRISTILQVLPKIGQVIVEGVNIKKKHVKPNPQKEQPGGIIPREAPLHACKVALYDPTSGKASRVGMKVLADGQKVRYFKSSGEVIDV